MPPDPVDSAMGFPPLPNGADRLRRAGEARTRRPPARTPPSAPPRTRPQYRRSTGGGVDGSRPLAASPVRPSGRRVPVRSSSPNRAGPGARFPAVGYEWPAPPAAARCTTAGQPWFSAGTPLRLPARLLGSLDRAVIWTRFAPRPGPVASSGKGRPNGAIEERDRAAPPVSCADRCRRAVVADGPLGCRPPPSSSARYLTGDG